VCPSNPASALARLTAEVLAAAGVGHVILCPGSRSAPLAYELARAASADGPELHVRHDERVAAFTALGVGLSGTTIGALLTTSGTAAANAHPAVLEAHHANRPLVVVTADRPPELRGTWANQTSELQASLFGTALRARLDLADTDFAAAPDVARKELTDTLAACRSGPCYSGPCHSGPCYNGHGGPRPGPVHLNLGFSEPLVPGDDDLPPPRRSPDSPPALSPRTEAGPALLLEPGPRTIVLAGDGAGPQARAFAETAGLPLLAEPSSGARGGPNAVGPYRLLLELPRFGETVERVVVFGRPTLSRPVTRLIARPEMNVVLVSPYDGWPNPGRALTRANSVIAAPGDPGWLTTWRAASAAATAAIARSWTVRAAAG
jgi:2-succinyl-5-enolpyruvyl-6-hydroxy-3-cyclohexene-1-carboxylate synthase